MIKEVINAITITRRNHFSDHKTLGDKRTAFSADTARGVSAVDEKLKTVKLTDDLFDRVEFSGGLWRVQRPFYKQIVMVRGQEFIFGARFSQKDLATEEIGFFEYYHATMIGENCYGFYDTETYRVISHCGGAWAYGETQSDARAYLSSKLVDKPNEVFLEKLYNRIKQQNPKMKITLYVNQIKR